MKVCLACYATKRGPRASPRCRSRARATLAAVNHRHHGRHDRRPHRLGTIERHRIVMSVCRTLFTLAAVDLKRPWRVGVNDRKFLSSANQFVEVFEGASIFKGYFVAFTLSQ
jgi:hypothetical protein